MTKIDGNAFRQMMAAASSYLADNKERLDALNVFPVPDGDTGTNMSLTFKAASDELSKIGSNKVSDLATSLARGALMGARGNSGVILSQLLRGFAQETDSLESLDGIALAKCLNGASKMAYRAVIKPVEGTILTVAREAAEASTKAAREKNDAHYVLRRFVAAAKVSLDNTPNYLPVLREAGVVDAGGAGYLTIWEGILKYLDGELTTATEIKKEPQATFAGVLSDESIEFHYCTEFIIQGKNLPQNVIRDYLATIGDSLIVVGEDDLVKVHVHTNNPGLALEKAVKYGQLSKIKIENMVEQNIEAVSSGKASWNTELGAVAFKSAQKAEVVEAEMGIISIAAGDGLSEIMNSLGADGIVSGGQTMNPSTADILEAVEKCPSKNVIILPNNKNIITTAKQVPEITEKTVFVVESRSIPQGIKALLAYDPDQSAKENYDNMQKAIKEVKTGEVTFAVRDTTMNGIEIAEQDIIGLNEGKIEAVGKDVAIVVKELVAKLVDENSAILTLYYGQDVEEEAANLLKEELEKEYDDIEIEVYFGNQPLYYYLISVE